LNIPNNVEGAGKTQCWEQALGKFPTMGIFPTIRFKGLTQFFCSTSYQAVFEFHYKTKGKITV
jgi:hypothetical protein